MIFDPKKTRTAAPIGPRVDFSGNAAIEDYFWPGLVEAVNRKDKA